MEYNKKRCVGKKGAVTGCTAGIGLATARQMVWEGAEVWMLVRNIEKAKPLAEEMNAQGPGRIAGIIWFDADQIDSIEPAVEELFRQTGGKLDMFVNNAINANAAVLPDNDTVTTTSHATMAAITEGILGVSAEFARCIIPLMAKGGGGSIVNVSSTTGAQADTTRTYYGVAKAGVNHLTKHIALQYGRQGIRCNAVLPAFTLGEETLKFLGEAFRDAWVKHAYIPRTGLPEDQANAIMFFATDDSAWVTGQILEVSGGFGVGSPVFGDTLGS